MKFFKFLIVLALLMAFLITISATSQPKHDDKKETNNNKKVETLESIDSYKGSSRFFNLKKHHHDPNKYWGGGHNARGRLTCNMFPRVCHVKGSPGHDCCRKKCVNVRTDRLNCGMCGRRCRYPEICCNGRCVNPWYDRRNCGGCHNKCKRGNFCYNGMCNYA